MKKFLSIFFAFAVCLLSGSTIAMATGSAEAGFLISGIGSIVTAASYIKPMFDAPVFSIACGCSPADNSLYGAQGIKGTYCLDGINYNSPFPVDAGLSSLKRNYSIPPSFTLTGTAPAAPPATTIFAMNSADGTVEAINGALSPTADEFEVTELSTGGVSTGLAELKASLFTYALLIGRINYSTSSSAQLSNPLKTFLGSLNGDVETRVLSVSKDRNNQQFQSDLIAICKDFILTANMALSMVVNAGVNVALTFVPKGIVPYNTVL